MCQAFGAGPGTRVLRNGVAVSTKGKTRDARSSMGRGVARGLT